MSNSLGVIKSSTSLDAVKVLQPKMFLEQESKKRKPAETIVKILSANEISVPINKMLFTIAHILLGLVYIGFGVVVFYFGKLGLSAPVYIESHPVTNTTLIQNGINSGIFNLVYYENMIDFPITWLVGITFFISGLFNLLNISLFRNYYFFYLTKCKCPTRWVEYLITTGLNMTIISRTIGIESLFFMLCVAFLYASGTSYGYWTETIARPKNQDEWTLPLSTRMLPWGLGAIPITFAAITLVIQYYVGGVSEDYDAPHVHAILWTTFVLFPQFANVLAFQQFAKPKHYQRVELAYQVVSLITRFAVGGLLFGYVLMNETWEEQFS
jgi:hypothetical protein